MSFMFCEGVAYIVFNFFCLSDFLFGEFCAFLKFLCEFFVWVFVFWGDCIFLIWGVLIFCFFLVWGLWRCFWLGSFVVWLSVGLFSLSAFVGRGFCWVLFLTFCLGALVVCALFFHTDAQMLSPTLDSLVSPMCVAALPLPDAALHAGDTVPGARLTS